MVKLTALIFSVVIVLSLSYFAVAWTFDWWPLNKTEPVVGVGYVVVEVAGQEGVRFEGTVRVDGEERNLEGEVLALVKLAKAAEHTYFSARIRRVSGDGIIEIALLECPDGSQPRKRLPLGDEFHVIECGHDGHLPRRVPGEVL